MQPELAVRQHKDSWAQSLLASLENAILAVRPATEGPDAETLSGVLEECTKKFDVDYARLQDAGDVLFEPDITAYGMRATAIFQRWESEGSGPILPAFIACAADKFRLNTDTPEMQAAMMAAVLAEIPNALQYHGNEHYRKVMFHTIRLLATYNQSDYQVLPVLLPRDITQMLIAAVIHDLGHEGGDNMRDGIYTPGYMEQKATDIVRPYFEHFGLERDFYGDIEAAVFCTDITFFAGENSPCVRMKKIYRHYFTKDLPESEDVESMMIGKLRRFEDNPRLVMMAMLLHEADIATSAGLTYDQSKAETIDIMEERGIKTAGPKTLLRFLTEQLDGKLMTPAAQALFGSSMTAIMQQANDELAAGAETFYS